MIMYVLLCGFPPFYGETPEQLFGRIKRGKYSYPYRHWKNKSGHAKDLINKLLVMNPKERLTAAEVLKHPWVANGVANKEKRLNSKHLRLHQARRKMRRCGKSCSPQHSSGSPVHERAMWRCTESGLSTESTSVCGRTGPSSSIRVRSR